MTNAIVVIHLGTRLWDRERWTLLIYISEARKLLFEGASNVRVLVLSSVLCLLLVSNVRERPIEKEKGTLLR